MSGGGYGTVTLSDRIGPQTGLAVTETEATMGVGTSGSASRTGVFVEDMNAVRVSARNAGPNDVVSCKLQGNEFSPEESDSRWIDLVVFPNLPLTPGGAVERVIVQIEGHKWMRVLATCAAGETAALDLSWSGE